VVLVVVVQLLHLLVLQVLVVTESSGMLAVGLVMVVEQRKGVLIVHVGNPRTAIVLLKHLRRLKKLTDNKKILNTFLKIELSLETWLLKQQRTKYRG